MSELRRISDREFAPAGSGFDIPRIERAVREILLAIGENPDRDGLVGTPNRVVTFQRRRSSSKLGLSMW